MGGMIDPASLSPFIRNQQDRYREEFSFAYRAGGLDLKSDWLQFQRQHETLALPTLLRRYRKSRLAILGALDIRAGENWARRHLQTLRQVSDLADLLIAEALQASQQYIQARFGRVLNGDDQPAKLRVYALGKLGGRELNFSSDVDLVFVHDAEDPTRQASDGPRQQDAHSYFERQARWLIQLLDSVTAEGRVYRVDTRLRPFGAAGPVVCSHQALLNYLETEGREWERFAWLRARAIGTDDKSDDLLLPAMQPFLYRRHLDFRVFDHLRDMKARILAKQQGDEDNLKLGTGGIREAEFIVQSLQLAFAGRNADLRGGDLWRTLRALGRAGHLRRHEVDTLAHAWLFLRRLENLAQIVNDQQTHHLPDDPVQQQRLAQAFGWPSANRLVTELQQQRQRVHDMFSRLFASPCDSLDTTLPENWQQRLDNARLPPGHRQRIGHIMQQVVTDDHAVAKRLLDLTLTIGQRESYLIMLQRDPLLLDKLIDQLRHPKLALMLQQHPFLLENLFNAEQPADSITAYTRRWQQFCHRHRPEGEESLMELARQFKLSQQWTILQQAAVDQADAAGTTARLAHLAGSLVQTACLQSHAAICRRYSQDAVPENALMLLAYGSLASGHMHLDSDVDMVMLVDDTLVNTENPQRMRFLHRWTRRLIHWLTANMYHGHLYQLDTRLRPNGRAGLALVSLSAFARYQQTRAWVWEHLALVKSRLIYGTPEQTRRFEDIRHAVLCQPRNPKDLQNALEAMRQRMRQTEVNPQHAEDFAWLGLVLKHAHEHPEIIAPRDDRGLIAALRSTGVIDAACAAQWTRAQQERLQRRLQKTLSD